jgi:hypothetical protein
LSVHHKKLMGQYHSLPSPLRIQIGMAYVGHGRYDSISPNSPLRAQLQFLRLYRFFSSSGSNIFSEISIDFYFRQKFPCKMKIPSVMTCPFQLVASDQFIALEHIPSI